VLHIDEAGRGACVGDLVYGAFLSIDTADTQFDALWARHLPAKAKRAMDSKVMTERQRSVYFDAMVACARPRDDQDASVSLWITQCGRAAFAACSVSAERITAVMLNGGDDNLNTLSYEATARLIDVMTRVAGAPLAIIADRLGHDAASHAACVQRALDPATDAWRSFVSEPRADARYKGVSIASIVAKVTRDRALGRDVRGGGYPNAACTMWMHTITHPDPRIRYAYANIQPILDTLITDPHTRASYTIITNHKKRARTEDTDEQQPTHDTHS